MKNRLNEIRRMRGMSIAELARRAKTSRQTIYSIEKFKTKRISGELMFAIADALSCNERDIFFVNDVTHEERNKTA